MTKRVYNALTGDRKSIAASTVYSNSAIAGKTEYLYDSKGSPVIVRQYSSAGKYIETKNTFSENGWLISSTTAGVTIFSEYDPMGRVISETDGNGNATRYSYDVMGRVTMETHPDGSYTYNKYTVNSSTNEIEATDEIGNVTKYKYNNLGDIVSVYVNNQLIESM